MEDKEKLLKKLKDDFSRIENTKFWGEYLRYIDSLKKTAMEKARKLNAPEVYREQGKWEILESIKKAPEIIMERKRQ